ncbi:MAG: ABC transporter ATP-binding protein [Chloroflexi bacterium]|nr:ABC transporter ATP-binding protein [Chloroflexota bacterium]
MIRTENLSKFYNGFKAVQDLNLNVRAGEIYGFLGPNGAGKTTTLTMLLGITRPTHGKVWLFGQELRDDYFAIKRRIGVVSERQFLYDDVSGQEYLEFFAKLYRVTAAAKRIDDLLEAVHLAPFRDVLARDYSNGMKQKLGLARALLHDPDLLILDEPVSGLDPHGIMQVRNVILEQRQRGKAILISSHVLSEIERTADRVGIIHRGRLLAEDRMDNIRRRLQPQAQLEIEAQGDQPALVAALRELSCVSSAEARGALIAVSTPADGDYRAPISQCITSHGGVILAMRQVTLSLEEAFVTITTDNVARLTDAGKAA